MSFRPQVALCMPRYGDVSLGAARGFHFPGGETVDVRIFTESCSSATPKTFNSGFAVAMDARDAGDVTHFAMIHSDIEPLTANWLDVLWREMDATGATAISAVVPIKEPEQRRTSTAIGDAEDYWSARRYITNQHRGLLPTTFTAADVCRPGEVLLINTGLMLLDVRPSYWDDFAFEFRDRIIRHEGKRVAQFAPEDWLMSRHVQANGGIVAATWAVELQHHGHLAWAN